MAGPSCQGMRVSVHTGVPGVVTYFAIIGTVSNVTRPDTLPHQPRPGNRGTKRGQAQVTLADGTAEVVRKVTAAISDRELPAYCLYITAIRDLAASPGGKTVLLPGDLLQSLHALVGRGRSG